MEEIEKTKVETDPSSSLKEDVDLDSEKTEEQILAEAKKKKRYFASTGRRKRSTARVRLFTSEKKGIEVNGKDYKEYFEVESFQDRVRSPLEKLKCEDKFGFTVIVKGGGKSGQAGAVRHGIARSLVLLNPYFRKRLKKAGFLTRDPRKKERKKPGLKKARRAPQWSKR